MMKEAYLPFSTEPNVYESEALASYYAQLHDASNSAFYDVNTGKYVVWRYDDVALVLGQTEPGVSNDHTLDPMVPYSKLAKHPANWPHMARILMYTTPVTANAQGHTHHQVRKNLQQSNNKHSLRFPATENNYGTLVSEEVAATMHSFKEAMEEEGQATFDEAFARPLASRVINRAIGFGTHTQHRVKYWSDAQTNLLGQYLPSSEQPGALKGLAGLAVACHGLVRRKRRTGDAQGIAGMLANPHTGLSLRQAGSALMNLVAAGYSTTSGTLASSVERLAGKDREYWDVLPSMDQKTRKSLIDELMRLETGLTGWKRNARQDIELSDGRSVIPKGAGIIALIGAANQDPRKFNNPAEIDLTRHSKERKEAKQLTFGHGAHLCVGRELAKLEITTSIEALRDEFPALKLTSEAKEYDRDFLFRNPRQIIAQVS